MEAETNNTPPVNATPNKGIAGSLATKIGAITAILLALAGFIDALVAITTKATTLTCNLTVAFAWCPKTVLSEQPGARIEPTRPAEPIPEAKRTAPAALPPTSLLGSSVGRWAVGDKSNCDVPSKSYSLRMSGGNIEWRDGVGNIDRENIVFDGEDEFRSTTVQSSHPSGGGEPNGTRWVYSRSGSDRIYVQPSNKGPFQLARCR
jgi:hypothetical protein